jgi:eukaryotic-like serine/threonine-protein kinase
VLAERYRIMEALGEGSMGTVYAAEHLQLKKKLAVKVLHTELTSVKSLAIRFEREAMATAKIDHPNVAAAVDFGRTVDGSMYLALEFVEGRSLRSEIAKGEFSLPRALHVAKQIASLLAAAQPLGIVHRDLKPENVMLVQRSEDPDFVKVLDFGIARMIGPVEGEAGSTPALTKLGAVFGTPEYMAPEQALGQRVDTRADLYALGVMLFEMIAGVRPYVAVGGPSGILAQQITAPRPSFTDVAPHVKVPEAVERVVNRLLAKGVAERYQRASDVVSVLESLIVGTGSVGPSGSLIPAQKEALPAFELTTHVPGLPDDEVGESPAQEGRRSFSVRPTFDRMLASIRARQGVLERSRSWASSKGTALRERLARRLGPSLSGIPPLAILAFCVGLSVGLAVAVVVWIVTATRHGGSVEAGQVASACAGISPPSVSSAPVTAVAPINSATGAALPVDSSKDPDVMLGLMQGKLGEGRDAESVGLVVKVLSKHPDRRSDERIAEALYKIANSSTKEAKDTAFALLEGTMATKGADILYQLWLDKAVRDNTRRRAEKWLRSEPFARTASNALVIAMQLRTAESCEKKHELLPLAAKGGSAFALAYLRELDTDKGCGIDGKADCFPCLREDGQLKDAIVQIESRLTR